MVDASRLPGATAAGLPAGVADLIGHTPLMRLSRYLGRDDIALYAKLEAFNPGGSAKDRPARHMVEQALVRGDITRDSTLVESSSGNMGIGLAQICRYHGIALICVVDVNAQAQNVAIMAALGARIHRVTEPLHGDFLAARMAAVEQIVAATPGAVWLNQYINRDNPGAHAIGAIAEIDAALDGALDTLFVATSSTGTAQGCRDYLAERGRSTRVIVVDAVGSTLFGGRAGKRFIPGMGAGREPGLARGQVFSRVVRVGDARCVAGCRRAAEREALLVGGSAGGVLEAVRGMANELAGQRVGVILHDSGTRYLDTIFDDGWVADTLGVSPEQIRAMIDDVHV
ncbi:pyridoxal-phosphate dependent enzyme [uncultured Salinisphaera sp.]|uniref:pyridoxal-phosphate dependent enzyme n=1 Tax=uncultured Salinisphaera sp. TaxID=359372 RepID=UPI0032B19E25|tara:strand:- start:6279 stop:7304 length:1026 start_codon:yes stop_codon:yes gene_type:complete